MRIAAGVRLINRSEDHLKSSLISELGKRFRITAESDVASGVYSSRSSGSAAALSSRAGRLSYASFQNPAELFLGTALKLKMLNLHVRSI